MEAYEDILDNKEHGDEALRLINRLEIHSLFARSNKQWSVWLSTTRGLRFGAIC
jgi:hypothetical protein